MSSGMLLRQCCCGGGATHTCYPCGSCCFSDQSTVDVTWHWYNYLTLADFGAAPIWYDIYQYLLNETFNALPWAGPNSSYIGTPSWKHDWTATVAGVECHFYLEAYRNCDTNVWGIYLHETSTNFTAEMMSMETGCCAHTETDGGVAIGGGGVFDEADFTVTLVNNLCCSNGDGTCNRTPADNCPDDAPCPPARGAVAATGCAGCGGVSGVNLTSDPAAMESFLRDA